MEGCSSTYCDSIDFYVIIITCCHYDDLILHMRNQCIPDPILMGLGTRLTSALLAISQASSGRSLTKRVWLGKVGMAKLKL